MMVNPIETMMVQPGTDSDCGRKIDHPPAGFSFDI